MIHQHLVVHGMDTISYLPCNGIVRSVIKESDQFNKADAIKEYETISKKYDSYCKANDLAAAQLLLSAVDEALHLQITRFNSPTGSEGFITYWFAYLGALNNNNYDKRQILETALRAIVVTKYEQQNLELMADDVKKICDDLGELGAYNHANSVRFLESFAAAGDSNDPHMLTFRLAITQKLNAVKDAVEHIRSMSEAAQKSYVDKKELDYAKLLEFILEEYLKLKHNGHWGPANNPIDSKAPSLNVAATAEAKPAAKPDMTVVAMHALKAPLRKLKVTATL